MSRLKKFSVSRKSTTPDCPDCGEGPCVKHEAAFLPAAPTPAAPPPKCEHCNDEGVVMGDGGGLSQCGACVQKGESLRDIVYVLLGTDKAAEVAIWIAEAKSIARQFAASRAAAPATGTPQDDAALVLDAVTMELREAHDFAPDEREAVEDRVIKRLRERPYSHEAVAASQPATGTPDEDALDATLIRDAIGCLEHYKRQAVAEQDFASAADLRGGQFRLERILAERFAAASRPSGADTRAAFEDTRGIVPTFEPCGHCVDALCATCRTRLDATLPTHEEVRGILAARSASEDTPTDSGSRPS